MMEISQATPAGSSSSESLNGSRILDHTNSGPGLRYRQRFLINLPTGGLAEDIIIHASTGLRVKASHLIYNARHNTAPEQALVTARNGTSLMVNLPVPRLIHSIGFTSATEPWGKTTQLFRTDGEVVTEDAAASHHNSPVSIQINKNGARGHTDATATTGVAKLAPGIGVAIDGLTIAGFDTAPSAPPGNLGITDSRVVVKLKGTGFASLNAGSISHFNLSTGPENFRIGVRITTLGEEFFFLPLSFLLDQSVDAATELTAQLQDLLKRLTNKLLSDNETSQPPALLPELVPIELAFESDAPCTFSVSQFAVRYRLRRKSFPAGEKKQVLRFNANQPEQQTVSFNLPPMALLSAASVEIAGAAGDEADGSTADAPSLNQLLASAGPTGLRLDMFHRWASAVTANEPLLISAWDLLVSTLSENVTLYLELMSDSNGAPTEERLTSAEVNVPTGGTRLLRFSLPETLLLKAGCYWLRLESRNGSAVWLLREKIGSRIVSWQNGNSDNPATFSEQAGIAKWVVAGGVAGAPTQRPEITLLGQTLPAQRSDTNWVFDLMPALGDTTGSGAGSALLTKALTLLDVSGSPVTVYPPQIEYDI